MYKPQAIHPKRLETERLILRPYRAGDGEMLYAAGLRNREHLTQYESGNVLLHLKDEEHAEAMACELADDWLELNCFFIGVFESSSGEWVGQVYVGPTNWKLPAFSIGFVADVHHEGKGYISEAVNSVLRMLFHEIGARRVSSDCHEDNHRSWRLLERCGFRREGHLRGNKLNPDGTTHGDYLYGLLKEEFEG